MHLISTCQQQPPGSKARIGGKMDKNWGRGRVSTAITLSIIAGIAAYLIFLTSFGILTKVVLFFVALIVLLYAAVVKSAVNDECPKALNIAGTLIAILSDIGLYKAYLTLEAAVKTLASGVPIQLGNSPDTLTLKNVENLQLALIVLAVVVFIVGLGSFMAIFTAPRERSINARYHDRGGSPNAQPGSGGSDFGDH